MVTADDVVLEARRWIGTPFRRLGRGEAGLDCVGLACRVAADLALSDYDVASYGTDPDPAQFMAHLRAAGCVSVPVRDRAPGMLGLFKDSIFPVHAAIFSRKHERLHVIGVNARRGRGVIEEPYAHDWPKLIARVYRLPGVTY